MARAYLAEVVLDIDAHGQVSKVEVPANVPSLLAGPAQEAIKHWRFVPPVREGHAVTARTYARVTLQLIRKSDRNYGLQVVYRSNGPRLTFTQAPDYPVEELRRRGEGTVVMEAVVQPDGAVTGITVASARFNYATSREFRRSAQTVMEHCHADPERVAGEPVATRVRVPFTYQLHRMAPGGRSSGKAGKRAGTAPGAGSMPPGPIGEATALDSPVQLLTRSPPG